MDGLSQFRKFYLTEARALRLIEAGRCPNCEMKFDSNYHSCGITIEMVIHLKKS
jgi:hypothetical protein